MKIRPVILCGGAGTRLWPNAKKHQAKQFIDFGNWTLLGKTLERVKASIFDAPIISTNSKYLKQIKQHLKKHKIRKFKIVLEPIKRNTQIYIADTYGELNGLFEYCEFIFMGGSLVDHGGQNFLEAAAYGKTIIVGPYMYNFITETEEFLKNNCMLMVKNSIPLKHLFEKLIKSKKRRELFGSNAKKLLESKKGIIDNYSRNIKSLMS